MNQTLDKKRIIIFLAFAFGIAWAVALVVYLTGGLVNSPQLGNSGITLAFVLVAVLYMAAPTLANVLTRLVTGEGWRNAMLRPRLRIEWPYWLAAWFAPGLLTILGAVVYFLFFPQYFDPSLSVLRNMIDAQASAQGGPAPEMNLWLIVALQALQAMLIAPLINGLATFGEEFGWRAYLQPKLMPLGGHKAMLLMGVIWGVWHWPVIAMGHNYGLDYTGAPWLGMLAMTWFCLLAGTFLGWASLRAGSVWPAVFGHAAINGISGIGMLVVLGTPNLLLGPMPVGLIGSVGYLLIAALIFLLPGALKQRSDASE